MNISLFIISWPNSKAIFKGLVKVYRLFHCSLVSPLQINAALKIQTGRNHLKYETDTKHFNKDKNAVQPQSCCISSKVHNSFILLMEKTHQHSLIDVCCCYCWCAALTWFPCINHRWLQQIETCSPGDGNRRESVPQVNLTWCRLHHKTTPGMHERSQTDDSVTVSEERSFLNLSDTNTLLQLNHLTTYAGWVVDVWLTSLERVQVMHHLVRTESSHWNSSSWATCMPSYCNQLVVVPLHQDIYCPIHNQSAVMSMRTGSVPSPISLMG